MDKANLNQILLTPAAYLKLQAHPNPDIRDKYFINIKEVGKIFPKNGGEMTVYSFYQKDNNGNYIFGNDHDVSSSPEETKRNGITQFCNVNDISDNSIHTFSKFIQEDEVFHIEEYLKIFKRKGLELDLISSDLLFKTLFEYSYDYISATHLIPSKHRYFHDQFQRTDFYDYQGEAIKKMHRKGKTEFYRFLMIDMDELETDFKNNMVRFRQFIDWHAQVGIRLLQIDRETACRIINNVFGPINVEIGVGLWHDGFAIHFGPINEYINPKDQSVKLTRRTFWLYDKSNEMYPKSKKFFEELLDLYKKGGCRDMKDFPM